MKRFLLFAFAFLASVLTAQASHIHSTRAQQSLEELIGGSGRIEILSVLGRAAPAVSPSGYGRIYFDSGTNTFQMSENGGAYVGLGGAPANAPYIVQTPVVALSAEQALSALSTGLMNVTTTTGVITSIANVAAGQVLTSGTPAAWSASLALNVAVGDSRLHVLDSSAGAVSAFSGTTATFERATENYLSLLTNDTGTNALVFGFVSCNIAASVNSYWNAGAPYLGFFTNPACSGVERMRVGSSGVGIGTTVFGTSATSVLALGAATAPTTSPADVVQLWATDIAGAGTFGLNIRDEGGNVYSMGNNQILAAATGDHGWTSRTLLRAAADGAFSINTNAGTARFQTTSGAATVGTQMRTAQATAPTCTTNCGTTPSIAGSDTSMIVTLGTGSPASPVTVTFNGTYNTVPPCHATNRTTAANSITRVDTTTTTAVIYFAAGPTASDVISLTCIGNS